MNELDEVSVVIPTLNAEECLPRTLAALHRMRVVVIDGGSSDRTREIAAAERAMVLTTKRGRGVQLAEGARLISTPWLLFLHADTVPGSGWRDEVRRFISSEDSGGKAAAFRFALDDASPQARRLERLVSWRCRVLALPYGDQDLLIHRKLYDEIGGYRALPLMEDVDIVRRIGSRRLALLETPACTSARRWQRDGWSVRSGHNLLCLALHFAGLSSGYIARVYDR